MRDITHFLLATLLSLATLACRHDTPPADGSLSRQLPPDTKEILRQLNDRDNREEALRLADSLAALPPSDDPWLEIRIAQAVANTLYKFRRDHIRPLFSEWSFCWGKKTEKQSSLPVT